MTVWFLNCPYCNKAYIYTEVTSDIGAALGWSADKVEIPDGGLSAVCPKCKNSYFYQRNQLSSNWALRR